MKSPSRKQVNSWLVNAALIFICFVALIPVATTVLISFKGERDTIRKPPDHLPMRHADQRLRPDGMPLGGGRVPARAGAQSDRRRSAAL